MFCLQIFVVDLELLYKIEFQYMLANIQMCKILIKNMQDNHWK